MKIEKRISVLGALAMTAVLNYGLLTLQSSASDWRKFWLGKHA
ncbi:MAG: hypothetical protein ACOY16_09565 [Chloroflexota bacterium]